ncbi:hypothetical protein [Clostridium cellulovorans]|uniref:Uncharacterized protein n=1 Tax=Clostridium cellulovorans (strain ATCC 35296 / DSM 3052 / OCM 3 / 743B) TaxID=573061 RepID=D9SU85_CLOC7|nr:hypothetical protein [Clostridium cellulovorans]ADL52840.1 hypothetical protein Clocel_3153 [Clostridium cellulovorans 743B]
MSNNISIIFDPKFQDSIMQSVEITIEPLQKSVTLDANNWVPDLSKLLEGVTGQMYLDTRMSKIIIDSDLRLGGDVENCWLEIIPYNSEKFSINLTNFSQNINEELLADNNKALQIEGLQHSNDIKEPRPTVLCEYPFSVSSVSAQAEAINDINSTINNENYTDNNVVFLAKKTGSNCYFSITQDKQSLSAVLAKGSQYRNIDTSVDQASKPPFYFKGNAGFNREVVYIDGEFICVYKDEHENDTEVATFGFYLESKVIASQ